VIARGGRVLISSEGIGSEQPRVAPAIVEYTQAGRFVRQLAVPEKFIPNPTGALIRGVRDNFGLEALTLSPSGRRLFTAGETSLVQDGEPVTFDRGATARLIEYVESGDTFTPGREFPYPLAAIDKVPFEASLSVMGVVELLALSDTEMLALERTFVEQAGTPGRGVNRARIYRVSIDGATDVSSVGSLRNAAFTPVKKTLLLDLSTVQGLSPDLANLDNFEGLAFGHGRANGPRVLVVISDDNLNPTQRSWFLLLRLL
jgi:hypothetical protein